MAAQSTTTLDPWREAVATYAHLLTGQPLPAVTAPMSQLVPELGEYAVADIFGGLTFARYLAAPVVYSPGGSRLILSTTAFCVGYAVAEEVRRGIEERRVQRMAAEQWRDTPLQRVLVTTRRLWCAIGPKWKRFDFDEITGMWLDGDALLLSFATLEPLRLAGAWAPWCAAVIAHRRFGPDAPRFVPSLHADAMRHCFM